MDGYSVIPSIDRAFHQERRSHRFDETAGLVQTKGQEEDAITVGICFALALLILAAALMVSLIFPERANAAEIPGMPEHVAVDCILGEARGHGYFGMLTVAEGLRERGHTGGVEGCWKIKQIPAHEWRYMEAKGIIQQAFRAWRESEYTNITDGADHWFSADYAQPSWTLAMQKTGEFAGNIFYRSKS